MLANGKLDNNIVEDTSDKIEESMWRLKIKSGDDHDNHGGEGAQSSPYPDRPGEPDCIYYLRTGLCGYGTNCRFNHPSCINSEGVQYEGELPQRIAQPDCGYFLKTGTCKFASTCKYNHPLDRHGAEPVSFNTVGLPMRQEEKPCPYYMKTGFCKFGYACKFHHPEPTSIGTSLPGQAHSSFKPMSSQGWNIYMGNMSSLPSTSILGYNAQVNSLSTSILYYPERPDQPDCRYFMNTGTCKYGSDCKYNHPAQRMAQLATNFTGPYGLPLRPGQTVCWYYNLYGICKYGPTCKFDHPLAGYPYTNGLSMSPLPMVDPSLYLPRNSSAVTSSEITASMSPKNPVSDKKPQVEISLEVPFEETESASQSLQTPSEPHD